MNFQKGEILYLDKPLYWTSFDLVNKVRHVISKFLGLKKIKVGHAGTLDPLATGVMIICTGKATKKIEAFQHQTKEYIATIHIGATTPSFDLETPIDNIFETSHITRKLVEQTLSKFLGNIEQTPPTFSSCKINGSKAYELARKNQKVELKPKLVFFEKIELLSYKPKEIQIHVVCSKGSYIRALTRDIGITIHSGAYLTKLTRTRIGNITLDDCLKIENLDKMLVV
ncbi:MAG: tRNA pseudouridine(55) synthase TruB [Candidatus Azobacteroides pseudotrichonymphae]|jgi:tRNA pseudouridine55 synthase|uniref:tRNA pseudouridine synthase B n=1 Tax=Azobacteroides pseudotrichonymphae genomovar. CFP2 TaxID=511995 RepID=B6YR70_AZOPC|nr:tRNA pseudouridine(55) synthase TruB [Candidatus Azobacteroides pseudotrichonymphae]MDR0530082.1 tRNA pseudouridine(55) synthase TruB [Bacteroidales bacterium OttesenSCG-928-I14]BAG83692.1 tRNA pseudouridine synthase B [Candidatus Azobacteroides pseudotrichonymphae genomovar. CFP2]GMO31986.1 MAG: tRNA pseudouridine(55) synthase TruB [Candidatus Azobacteroides pseudotrichonymphae]